MNVESPGFVDESVPLPWAKVRANPELLPDGPGVYLFKGCEGRILYVGKASSLRQRVRAYAADPATLPPRTARLVNQIHTVHTLVTRNASEALILEATLVRRHKPPYNVMLREGQRYPYVCFSPGPFPRLVVTRVPTRYPPPRLGPYTDVGALRSALQVLRRVVPLRTCADRDFASRTHPCVQYQMKRCIAPCVFPGVQAEYRALVRRAVQILEGRVKRVTEELAEAMREKAEQLQYEEAALLRDRMRAVARLGETQRVVLPRPVDLDVVAVAKAGTVAVGVVRMVRDGALVAQRTHPLHCPTPDTPVPELLEQFLSRCYAISPVPPQVVVAHEVGDREGVAAWLGEVRGAPVHVRVNPSGKLAQVVQATRDGAASALRELLLSSGEGGELPEVAVKLAHLLSLPAVPRRIAGMDASHLSGRERVGAVVVFVDGVPRKAEYRRYSLHPEGDDDASMLGEMARRWAARVARGQVEAPDLVLVDGGPVQVQAVKRAMEAHHLAVPLVGLAKREEVIHGPWGELRLSRHDEVLKLLQRIRDEAHRFAVTSHRAARRRTATASVLEEIPGLGKRRAGELLRAFGSLEGLRQASLEDILKTRGIGPTLAARVVRALQGSGE